MDIKGDITVAEINHITGVSNKDADGNITIKKIDYNSLANLPDFDEEISKVLRELNMNTDDGSIDSN